MCVACLPACLPACLSACLPCRPQAKTRKLAEKRVPKGEIEEMERRRAAEEAEDRKGAMQTIRQALMSAAAVHLQALAGLPVANQCLDCVAYL